jgi:hypothetical protein|tara:strand:+ start:484 stop:852 length:369 start_codon:yes stop_codon:yes gene_type:complete
MDYEQILKRFPFLSIIRSNDKEYLGIIQQSDSAFVMFFDYNSIRHTNLKKTFITLGETWWWESNRKIPITFFLYNDMKEFYPYLMVLSAKNTTIDRGHEINLFNISEKRTKRRTIELVKKPN